MINKKIVAVLLVLFTLTIFTFSSEEIKPLSDTPDMQLLLHDLVYKYWKANEAMAKYYYHPGDMEKVKEIGELYDAVDDTLDYLVSLYGEERYSPLSEFLNEYDKLDSNSKKFIYDEVLTPLKEYERNTKSAQPLVSTREQQYIPGYGYTDPDYLYKLGREIKSEHVQDFWKKEKRTFESSKKHKIYVKASVAAQWTNSGSAGGNIEGFDITGSTNYNVNGQVEDYVEVEITLKETVETYAVIMYEKRKVFFELFKAKKSFWNWLGNGMDFKWVRDGECFLYKEFPAKTDQIIEAQDLANF
ncbi:MAG: hypothetical protein C0601_05190 [Candidatus Muiribacterium halophilum]|uniref:Uncharacterized protein n=1 Tax=Muiribacterium halophilum TaxID=2053465 RepID=A0A2N5ZIA5_MUIH1|nr:MAG: hypothetical protein C0601_05190 [Candidatus Muirbacterium halophilum]